MNTSSTIPCNRITTFLCALVIVLGLFTSQVNAQQLPQPLPLNPSSAVMVQNPGQFQLVPAEEMSCDCSGFTVCITSQVNTCYGECNGSAKASASGGDPSYSYSWSTNPVQNTATAANLCAGTYTVTATDQMGCTATSTVVITSNPLSTISIITPDCASDSSTCKYNFNGTSISCGNYIWFNAVCKINNTPTYPLTIYCTNQKIYCSQFTLTPPCAELIIDPNATEATTKYNGSEWVTTAPPNLSGNYFISGYAYQVCNSNLGGLNPVNWSCDFTSSESGIDIQWQWSAAVYTSFCTNLGNIGVKPCDDNNASQYKNSDHACSPENYKSYVIGGACGGGGSNYTGSCSGTGSNTPCVSSICKGSCIKLTICGSPCSTYTWSPSTGLSATTGSSVSACPTVTTTYTVTGQDKNECATTGTVVVTVNPGTTITIPPATICYGSCATLTISGSPCASYTWSPSTGLSATTGSSVSACPTITTTYTVTGPDKNGCSASGTVVVTVNPGTTISIPPATICQGSCATLTISGAPCASYTWSPSTGLSATTGSSVTACPTVTTTYTVTGADKNGCVATGKVVVTVNPTTTITIPPATICYGSCATLTVSGSPCESYTWTPSTGLSATTGSSVSACPSVTTTYTVTGSDKNGCVATGKVVVTVNPTTTITIPPATICYGSCATLTVSGSPCESYTWTPSTGLSATTGSSVSACPTVTTTYTVTGSDKNGCVATGTVVVTVNPTPTISVPSASVCYGNCAVLTASGATSYTWSPATGLGATTGSSVNACPTATTTYTITGTNGNNCTGTTTSVVTVKPLPTISVPPASVCYGNCATLTANGATSYTWSPATGLSATMGSSVNACPTSTTTYTINGTNSYGCTGTTTTVVTVNPLPTVSVTAKLPAVCSGNPDTLIASGATTYTWSPSAGLNVTTGSMVIASPTVNTTYTVTGTNSNGCVNTDTISVVISPAPVLKISINPSSVCSGSPDTLIASGGASYIWSPATGLSATTGSSVIATPTASTTYTVIGISNVGCADINATIVPLTVNPKPTIAVPPASICYGSCTTLTASGATSYTWSPATGLSETTGSSVNACPTVTTTYTIIGTNSSGCNDTTTTVVTVNPLPVISVPPATVCIGNCATLTASGATTYTWSPVTALSASTGVTVNACPEATTTYTVTGTNSNGCVGTTTVVVTVNPLPVITLTARTPICLGSSDTIRASGATSYTWSPATGLSATTGSSVIATPTVTTKYKVIGTNGNGCVCSDSITITVNPLPVINVPPAAVCYGNCAALTATGASTYTWYPSIGLSATTGSSVNACPTATTTYTVTGTNGNGCSDTATAVVGVNPLPTIHIRPKFSAICTGNTDTLTASGAGENGTYVWTPSGSLSASTGAVVIASPTATTTYTVTGTNGNGCSDTATAVVGVNPLPTIHIRPKFSAICTGNTDTLTASGLGEGGTYTWSPSGSLSASTGAVVIASPTATTTYTVTGTNGNGCSDTATAVVGVNPLPTIHIRPKFSAICTGNTDTLTASGLGEGGTYTWSPSGSLSASTGAVVIASPTATTTYTVTGTNGNGCSDTATAVVGVNPLPTIHIRPKFSAICTGNTDTLTASGLGEGGTYTWSPSGSLSASTGAVVIASPTATTTYTVTGTNGNGCSDTATAVVGVNPLPTIHIRPKFSAICTGNTDTLTASGLGEGGTYTWSPSGSLSASTGAVVIASPTATTTYTVTGTNGNGCSDTATAVVGVNPLPTIHIRPKFSTICTSNTDTLTASGAGENGTYVWTPSGSLSASTGAVVIASPTATTTYTVTGTNGNGCSDTATAVVIVHPLPTISVPPASVCYGSCAVLTASGASTYTWSLGQVTIGTGSTIEVCPTATTTYTVTGTSEFGCVGATTVVVTVTPKTVLTLQLKNDTVCAGANVTFRVGAEGSGLTYTWYWNWTLLSGHTSDTLNIPSVSLADSGTYSVIVSGTCGKDTSTATLKVNSKPIITIQPRSNTMCAVNGQCGGHQFCVTAIGVDLNYQWYFKGNPIPGAIQSCYSFDPGTYADTGKYFVIVSNQCGSDTSDTAIFILVNSPVINVPSATICYGNCATLTVSGTGAIYYSWSPATGLSATTGSSVNACPTITTTYTITATGIHGCPDTTTTVVTVNPPPTISVPPASVCYGSCTTLQASGLGENGTYTWSASGGESTSTGASIQVCPTVTTTYTIIGTNGSGCSDTTTTTVTVNPLPVISVPSATVCYGSCATLTASGALYYTWSPATGLSATTGSSVNACPTITTTYTIRGTNGNYCTGTTTAVVTVNPLPIISVPGASVCIGNCATLTASGAVSYTWSPATGLSATTGSSVNACPEATTTYTITGTNGNNCVGTTTTTVTVNPLPVITLTATSSSICIGGSDTIRASGATLYTWSPATGLSATTGATVIASPTVTTKYKVIGTNGNGCVCSDSITITVNPLPVINVPPATVCYGNCAALTASGAASYTWYPATGLSATTGSSVNACPTATTTYTITGTNSNGCVGTTTTVVTVKPLPTISVPPATVCYGNCASLTASGAVSYTWSPSTGLSATTGAIVNACPTVTTTYTVNGTSSTDKNGCVGTTTVVVTVNPLPVISVPSASVCYGNCAVLTASGASSYTWYPSTGLSATTGAIVNACPTATTTYTITGTNSNGCVGTTTSVVTVDTLPTIKLTESSTSICVGGIDTLRATGANSYTWKPAVYSREGLPYVTVDPTVTTTYTVIGTNNNGCEDSANIVVIVNPLPTVSVPPATVCYGNSAVLTASGASTYTWSPATGLSATTGSSVTAGPLVTTTYTVIGTNESGCMDTTTTTVTVNPKPSISVPPASICYGSCATLQASGLGENGTYTWSTSGGESTSSGPSVQVCPTATTTYTIIGTNGYGCSDTITTVVTVNPKPSVTVPPASICYGSSTVLTASGGINSNDGSNSYTWSPATGLSATTGSSVTANPTATTTYTIIGTNGFGCSDTTTTIVTVHPLPSVSVPPASICYGKSTVLTASGATTYTWKPATGLSATTGSIVTANPTTTTTYTIVGTNGYDCVDSTTTTVTVDSLPTVSVPPASICYGSSTVLTVSGAPSSSQIVLADSDAHYDLLDSRLPTTNYEGFYEFDAWHWTVGGNTTIGRSIVRYNLSGIPAGSTITSAALSLYGDSASSEDNGGSYSTTTNASYLQLLTSSWNPSTVTWNTQPDTTTTDEVTLPKSTSEWEDYLNINVTALISDLYNNPSTYTGIMLRLQDENPVYNGLIFGSNTNSNPRIHPKLVINYTPNAGNNSSDTYTWSPSTGLSATTGSSVTANPTTTTTYTVVATNGNGCTDTTTVVVTVNPLPTVSVPPATICYGGSGILTASGATTYTWKPATGLSATTGSIVTANPTATTTYTITGTNGYDCVDSTTTTVTVNPKPSISVPPATICYGSCATLQASGLGENGTYTWSVSAGEITSSGPSIQVCPTATTTYTVVGTNGYGCSDTITTTVTVNPKPTISVPPAAICYGSCTTLQASGLGEDGTYSWSSSSGGSTSSGPSIQACPTATTTYTIIGTNGSGCSDTTTAVVTVNPLPIVSVPPASVCIGNCATLTASGATTYTWSPATALSATTGATVNACPEATTTYTVTGTNGNGCVGTTTVVVTVNPLPVIILTAKTPSICIGGSDTIKASGATLYTWSPATGLSATTGAVVIASPTVTTKYFVIGTNGNGCVCSDSITIIVNPLPVINVPPATICYGSCTTLQASGLGENGTYTWSSSAGGSTSNGPSIMVCPTATTTYTVIGTNGSGCSDTTTTTVTVNPLPVISVPSATICYGSCTTLQASGLGENGTYTWSSSAGGSTSNGPSIMVCPTATTTYTIIGTNGSGCSDTVTAVVTVNPLPVISVPSATICYGSCTTLQASGLGENGTYTWSSSSGGSTSNGPSILVCPTATTTYTIIGTNGSGCSDTITAVVTVDTLPNIKVTESSPSICNGSFDTLRVSGANHYTWRPQVNIMEGLPYVTVNPTGTTTYTVIGTNSNGCEDSTKIVVSVLPKDTITTPLQNDTVCTGASVTFTVSASGTDLTYAWQKNGVTLSGHSSDTLDILSATLADSGVYSVIVSGTCGIDTSTAVLKVNGAPGNIGLIVNDSIINSGQNDTLSLCANAGQPLFITLNVNGTNLTFQWQKNDTTITGAVADTFTIPDVTISSAGSYRVIVTGPCGSDTSAVVDLLITNKPIIVSIYVNDEVVISKIDTISVCAGSQASFSVVATPSGLTYQWQKNGVNINGATSSTYTIDSTVHSDGGLYDVIVTGTCGSDTAYAPLRVKIKPKITSPPSSVTMCAMNGKCGGVSFCVQAIGANLKYQWYHDGKPILGATDSCYSISPATFADTGGYHVVVSNECGSDTSRRVELILYSAPVIISQPVCLTVCLGSSATFCVTATGSNLTYQWQFNGKNINGADSACYTIPSVALCNAGCYDVVVSNSCGSVTSYVARLTINTPPVITCQPKGESLCSTKGKCGGNDGVTFCVTATGSDLTYQWQYNGKNIKGANSSCYTINPVTKSDAGCYDVIVSNSCGSDTSNIAVLTIGSSPVITSQPVCVSVCSGSSATFCVTATGSNLTYQWQFNGKNIKGADSSCYTIPSAAVCNAGCYDVVVSNSCGSVTSCTVTLTINTPPVITCQPQSQSICSVGGKCGGGEGVTFCVTATGSNLSYQWQYNGKNINGAHSSCYTINPVTTSNAGCYDVIVSNSCGSQTSNTVTLTIGSLPVITSQPVCVTICSGNSATFCVTATGSNLSYKWQFNGKNINGATSCCYTIPSAAACNAGCYDVVVSNSCGSVTSCTVTLTVNGAPCITSQPVCQTVCAGSGVTFCVTASGSNLSYQWQYNGKNISGANSCCYTIESTTSSNAGCYDVIVSNSCSCVTSNTATLTVNNCSTCEVPTDLKSSDITCTGATLSWSYSSSASSFTVEYKALGCSTWSTETVKTNSLTLSCLTSGTTYEWSVSENCSCGSSSGYASVVEFCTSTNCCNGNNMAPRGDGNNGDGHAISDVKVYPNPTFSLTTVHATFEKQSDVTVMVTDLTGRIIMSETETAPAGDYIRQFDMSQQQAGTYFLIIRSGDQMITSKIVKIE